MIIILVLQRQVKTKKNLSNTMIVSSSIANYNVRFDNDSLSKDCCSFYMNRNNTSSYRSLFVHDDVDKIKIKFVPHIIHAPVKFQTNLLLNTFLI